MKKIDYHFRKQALTGVDNECGDIGVIKMYDTCCMMALVDVLGHGKEAFYVAIMAETYLLENYKKNPVEIIRGLHSHLESTRGAVADVCNLNLETGVLKYSGMGNISTKIMGNYPKRLTGKDGVLGYMIPSPIEQEAKLYSGDVLVLCSDGIKDHFDPIDFPDILLGSAGEITDRFIDRLGKKNDDASCIAVRYGI